MFDFSKTVDKVFKTNQINLTDEQIKTVKDVLTSNACYGSTMFFDQAMQKLKGMGFTVTDVYHVYYKFS